jgi:hypothetical protein
VVGVGGVGVSTDEVLDLVQQTLLVSTGRLEVLVVNPGSGLLTSGQTGRLVVVVSRVGSVSLGEVITVSGDSGKLVVVGSLVVRVVTVLVSGGGGRSSGDGGVSGDTVVPGSVEPVGTGGSTRDGSTVLRSLESANSLVSNTSGRPVVTGSLTRSSKTRAGSSVGSVLVLSGSVAGSVDVGSVSLSTGSGVDLVVVASDLVLDLVSHGPVLVGKVLSGSEVGVSGLLISRNDQVSTESLHQVEWLQLTTPP